MSLKPGDIITGNTTGNDYEKVIGVVLARAVEKHTPFNQDMFA